MRLGPLRLIVEFYQKFTEASGLDASPIYRAYHLSMVDKSHLLQALLTQLNAELELLVRAANLARDEATNEESRADNKYDTRGQEAAYLAEGQAKLATELAKSISIYRELTLPSTPSSKPIEIGSIVRIERPGGTINGLVGPRAGGTAFSVGNTTFTVITPASPLGKLLIGRKAGETIFLTARGKPQAHRISETE